MHSALVDGQGGRSQAIPAPFHLQTSFFLYSWCSITSSHTNTLIQHPGQNHCFQQQKVQVIFTEKAG